MSSAHTALYNTDLLSCIFSQLMLPIVVGKEEVTPDLFGEEETPPVRDRRSLARAARVCKTFSDPALLLLWSSLRSLMPLWHILGLLKVPIDPPTQVDERLRLGPCVLLCPPEITPGAWQRFREYTTRVRAVPCRAPGFPPSVHPSVWHFLTRQLRGTPLLPRLHTLYWTLCDDPYDATLLTVLPSTAATLSLDFGKKYWDDSDSDDDDDDDEGPDDDEDPDDDIDVIDDDTPQHLGTPAKREEAVMSMLRAVCSDTPRLSDLTICKCKCPGPLLASILPALPGLRRLDLSETYPVDVETLRVLSCVATLETLENVPIKNARVDGAFTGFPALKTLGVVGAAEETEQLLAAITSPLTCVAIKSRRVAMWEAAFPRMEDPMSTVTMFELNILASDPDPYDADDMTLYSREAADLAQLLTPLATPLAQLQVLRLSFRNVKPRYDINQLTQLAQTFPCLTHFSLAARVLSSVGYPTLAAVASFARHCPHLETLFLPQLSFTDQDITAIRDPFLPVQHALRTLCVLDMGDFRFEARLVDSDWLGSTLAAMFPSLDVQACVEPPYSWLHIDRVRTWDDGSVTRVRVERVKWWKERSAQWRDMLSVIGRLRTVRQ